MAPSVSSQTSGQIPRQKELWNQMKLVKEKVFPLSRGLGGQVRRLNSSVTEDREVKIKMFNLPTSIVASDLRVQFEDYEVRHILIHSDQSTAIISLSKSQASQLLQKFFNLVIEGKKVNFQLIDTFPSVNRNMSMTTDGQKKVMGEKRTQGTLKKPESSGKTAKFMQKLNDGVVKQNVLESCFDNLGL